MKITVQFKILVGFQICHKFLETVAKLKNTVLQDRLIIEFLDFGFVNMILIGFYDPSLHLGARSLALSQIGSGQSYHEMYIAGDANIIWDACRVEEI